MSSGPRYGVGDATFQAAGGETGLRALTDAFYQIMSSNPKYRTILDWHGGDLGASSEKLARFLCGWAGGPRRYDERFGPISIPRAHAHLNVTETERDLWLSCMAEALSRQPYPRSLIDYLLTQFAFPAERIRVSCARRAVVEQK